MNHERQIHDIRTETHQNIQLALEMIPAALREHHPVLSFGAVGDHWNSLYLATVKSCYAAHAACESERVTERQRAGMERGDGGAGRERKPKPKEKRRERLA